MFPLVAHSVIQKRLLVRFKDRNPAPLNQLDVLLQETYNRMVDMGTDMVRASVPADVSLFCLHLWLPF